MARSPVEIPIGSDTGPFEKGVKAGIIDPLDDAIDKLDELGRNRGPGELEQGMRDAQRQTENLADETRTAARRIEDDFHDAYRGVGDSTKDGFDRAGHNVEGFKDEAIQNLSEVASSWQGDLQGMADGVQGLTGGLASALTPGVGIPIAILGAVAGAFLQSWATAAEDTKQQISDMYADMLDSGQAYLSQQFIQQGIGDIYGDQDKYNDALSKSKQLGIDVVDVIRAQAGDMGTVSQLLADQNAQRQTEIDAVNASSDSLSNKAVRIDAINTKYGEQDRWLQQLADNEDSAANRAEGAHSAISNYLLDQISKTQDVGVELDAVGNKLVHLPDGDVLIRADTGEATTKVDAFQGDVDGVVDHLSGRAITLDLDDSRARRKLDDFVYAASQRQVTIKAQIQDRYQ